MEEINENGEEELNAAINHDEKEFSDEEDASSDEEDASSDEDENSEEVRRQIECNEPDLDDLTIGLGGYITYDDDWERFGESVGNNTKLRELIFVAMGANITKEDLEKFFRGVAHNRSVKKLSFDCGTLFDGELFNIMVPFFKENHHFERIDLRHSRLEHECRHAFVSALTKFGSLKELNFRCHMVNDDEARELIQALTGHSGLKKLILCNVWIGRHGCAALRTLLQNLESKLAVLELESSKMNDEVAADLAMGLTGNSTLKMLDLSDNEDITGTGWRAIFTALQSPNCTLEQLHLFNSGLNDDTMTSLAPLLAISRSLRSLDLSGNPEITITGWEALSFVLQHPDSALEELSLSDNELNDDILISLAPSLIDNNKLKELDLSFNLNITVNGWAAFSRVLCNASSIMDTFRSNHTLQELFRHECSQCEVPESLRSPLRLNRENGKSQSARLKIIKTHFSGSKINLQFFIAMELQVLPHAIAWMGRDGIDDNGEITTETNGRSLLYQFLQNTPLLLLGINGSNREP